MVMLTIHPPPPPLLFGCTLKYLASRTHGWTNSGVMSKNKPDSREVDWMDSWTASQLDGNPNQNQLNSWIDRQLDKKPGSLIDIVDKLLINPKLGRDNWTPR